MPGRKCRSLRPPRSLLAGPALYALACRSSLRRPNDRGPLTRPGDRGPRAAAQRRRRVLSAAAFGRLSTHELVGECLIPLNTLMEGQRRSFACPLVGPTGEPLIDHLLCTYALEPAPAAAGHRHGAAAELDVGQANALMVGFATAAAAEAEVPGGKAVAVQGAARSARWTLFLDGLARCREGAGAGGFAPWPGEAEASRPAGRAGAGSDRDEAAQVAATGYACGLRTLRTALAAGHGLETGEVTVLSVEMVCASVHLSLRYGS